VLSIWNARVADVRKRFSQVRTVVLIKADDLLEVAAFELETVLFQPENYRWSWNDGDNLVGFEVLPNQTEIHKFTWQPHGSQFTIVEDVPKDRLAIKIKQPPELDREAVLKALNFEPSWITEVCHKAGQVKPAAQTARERSPTPLDLPMLL